MARTRMPQNVDARIGQFVARHPRLVTALLATFVLLAVQDGAMAADGTLTESTDSLYVEPTDDASADPGPEPEISGGN